MILKMNAMIREQEVFRSHRGKGLWFVRQPNIHAFEVVHRAEDGSEAVGGRYSSFEEAFWEADRLAEEAHLEFVEEGDL